LTADSAVTTNTSDLPQQLKDLRLPTIRELHCQTAEQAARDNWTHLQFLSELTTKECESRSQNRIVRLMKDSHLLAGKTWDQFQWSRLPLHVTQQFEILRSGSFLDRQDNLLIFGKPGSGKTNLLAALGDQLVRRGRSVFFTTCQMLVQELLRSKRDLRMERFIKKLSKFEALIIDDLGYVQQSREEMEVLFTLLSERYERGSVLLSSNLPFSKWEQIFKDPMTTAAAIDRLIHHSVIIELNIASYRLEAAKEKGTSKASSDGSKRTAQAS
jgi:DNA replication protein DnaC